MEGSMLVVFLVFLAGAGNGALAMSLYHRGLRERIRQEFQDALRTELERDAHVRQRRMSTQWDAASSQAEFVPVAVLTKAREGGMRVAVW